MQFVTITGEDMRAAGWVIVQPDIYRFAVMNNGQFVVRAIIREYLTTEVVWRIKALELIGLDSYECPLMKGYSNGLASAANVRIPL